jgi:MazG family protein
MEQMNQLLLIIKKLRAPDGCPWDREQTHESIRGHLVEECAEFLDAVDAKNYPNMCEELGDLLMHILLHSEIASEEGRFDFNDVAKELADKLVRRHPHVFGEVKAESSDDVMGIWKEVKSVEKKSRPKSENFWLNLPSELSALRKAYDVSKHIDKTSEEKTSAETVDSDFGKRLYELASECAKNKIEPEGALRDYIKRLRANSDPDFNA